jgi:hypothetical protein
MRENVAERDRPQIMWRMRTACWIHKATNTHTRCEILIGFRQQKWLHERASMLRYTYIVCLQFNKRGNVRRTYLRGAFAQAICITYCERVFVALVIQHALSMLPIVICGLRRFTIFSAFSHKRHDFRKKKLPNVKCVSTSFYTTFLRNIFILRRTQRDRIKNVYLSSCQIPIILLRLMKL